MDMTIQNRREAVAAASNLLSDGHFAPEGDYVRISRRTFGEMTSCLELVAAYAEILAPRQCPLCASPVGEPTCTHVNVEAKHTLRQVIMTEESWARQVEIINDLRSRVPSDEETGPLERIARSLETLADPDISTLVRRF